VHAQREPTQRAEGQPADPRRSRALARLVLLGAPFVIGAALFLGYGLLGPSDAVRCTTEYTAPANTSPAPAEGQLGPVGLPATRQTCAPVGLTDPPLVIVGITFLLLAIPALGINQLGFGGLTMTRAVTGATEAARSASQAADRAATAMLTFATMNVRTSAAAAGNNLTVYTGDPSDTGFDGVETAAAFTLAANGVTEAVRRVVPGVTAAVLLWHDPATDSLRPALRAPHRRGTETLAGVDMRSPLGEIARRGRAVPVAISEPSDAEQLGLDQVLSLPAPAAAIPVARPGRAAVGLLLVFVDTEGLAEQQAADRIGEVIEQTAPFALSAAVLIERLTSAGTLVTGKEAHL